MIQQYKYIFDNLRKEIQNPASIQWFEWREMKKDVEMMAAQNMMQEIHEQMNIFYGAFFYYQMESTSAWGFIDFVAQKDEKIGAWATENIDLMKLIDRWIEIGNVVSYTKILALIGRTGYKADWHVLRTTIDEKIRRMEVDGTRNGMKETGYYYCALHAFIMIMMSLRSMEEKMELLQQFSNHWRFLCYMYSVMTRVIIGFAFQNYASVTNNLTNNRDLEPFYHLYYSILKERFDDLCEKGTKRDRLEASIKKMEEKMAQATPSDELDVLCEVLFPEDFREMLNKHRPKSYQELEREVGKIRDEMESTVARLRNQASQMAVQLRALVESSVPIQQIEDELMKLPSMGAYNVWLQLNGLLIANTAWKQHAVDIRNKILEKQKKEMQLNMEINAMSGSTVNGFVQHQINSNTLELNRQLSA